MFRHILRTIFFYWAGTGALIFLFLLIIPHRDIEIVPSISLSIQVLLAFASYFITRLMPSKGKRIFFLHLFVLFSFQVFSFLMATTVRGTLLTSFPYASFYAYQYCSAIYFFILLFVVIFGVMLLVSQERNLYQRYILSLLIAGVPFVYFYHPIFLDPMYLYTTQDIQDYKSIDQVMTKYRAKGNPSPTVDEITKEVVLSTRSDLFQNTNYYYVKKRERVEELLPFLIDKNYIQLIFKPISIDGIFMSSIGAVALILMMISKYYNDYSGSAYLEKILLFFFPYCLLEALHLYCFSLLADFEKYLVIERIGAVLTGVIDILILVVLLAQLSFINSSIGKFYEGKIAYDPLHVSRWRDFIDEFIIRHFLNDRKFRGRLFSSKSKDIID